MTTELTVQEQRRDCILDLEQAMINIPGQVELPVVHHFANNVYGREMFIPEGVTLVGKLHIHPCISVVAQGSIRVATEFGYDVYTAPDVWVSPPGSKRAIYAEQDTVLITFHPCSSTDLTEIEQSIIAPSYDKLLEAK